MKPVYSLKLLIGSAWGSCTTVDKEDGETDERTWSPLDIHSRGQCLRLPLVVDLPSCASSSRDSWGVGGRWKSLVRCWHLPRWRHAVPQTLHTLNTRTCHGKSRVALQPAAVQWRWSDNERNCCGINCDCSLPLRSTHRKNRAHC